MAGGLFDSFQRAVDLGRARRAQDEEQLYIQGERAYQDARRAKLDPINDELLGLQVGEARFNAEGQPLRRRQQIAQTTSAETGAKLGEFNLRRAPTLAAQQDTLHGLNVESAGLNMTLARNRDAREGARHKRDMEESDYRLQAQRLQLDLAEVEKLQKTVQNQWMKSRQQIFQLGSRGDAEGVLATVNKLYEQVDDGNPDSGIRFDQASGKYYVADETGQPKQVLGDINGLLDFADLYVSSPEIFAQSYVGQRNAAAQRAAAEAAAEERRRAEEGKNFRAGLNALGPALANPLDRRDPNDITDSLVDAANRIAGSAPGASPRGAPERRPIPTAIVDQAVREIPARHIQELLRAAADPEDAAAAIAEFNDPAAFGGKYGPGIAEAILQRYADSRQRMSTGGER